MSGLFASVTLQTILSLFDCLDGRFDCDLYDLGPLFLTFFLGGFLDRFARFDRLRLRAISFLFRFLGFLECRLGCLDTIGFLSHRPSTQDKDGVTGWVGDCCYL